MTTTVTLLFFSGRRDPTWELAAGEAAALAPQLEHLPDAVPVDSLGYRGFLVRSDDPEMPRERLVRGAPAVERFLLHSGASHLAPEVVDAVDAAIAGAPD